MINIFIDNLRLKGILNLITAYPPLATALIISKFASSPWSEYRVRGWPPSLYISIRKFIEAVDWQVIREVLSNLVSSKMFIENYNSIVFYDAYSKRVDAVSVYNISSLLRDFGFKLAKFVKCIDLEFLREYSEFTGSSIEDARRADIVFYYKETPSDAEEEDVEEYACAPVWVDTTPDSLKEIVVEKVSVSSKLEEAIRGLREGNPRLYAYLKLAVFSSPQRAYTESTLLEKLPGTWGSIDRILLVRGPGKRPIVDYATILALKNVFRRIAEESIDNSGDYTFDDTVGLFYKISGGERVYYAGSFADASTAILASNPKPIQVVVLEDSGKLRDYSEFTRALEEKEVKITTPK